MHSISQLVEVHPFVRAITDIEQWFINRTPCLTSLCLLETNIRLLGDGPPRGHDAADLVTVEEYSPLPSSGGAFNYSHNSLSRAIDGIPATEFRSPFRKFMAPIPRT